MSSASPNNLRQPRARGCSICILLSPALNSKGAFCHGSRWYHPDMMKLIFPQHFQYRMVERGIDVDHIKKAIKEPEFTEPTFNGRTLARREIDEKRVIEVIYYRQGFKGANDVVVITAYYLPKEI